MEFCADNQAWLVHWEACKSALVQLVRDQRIRGVFWSEELAVNSLLPVRVLPHVHAIVDADDVDVELIRDMEALVAAYLERHLDDGQLIPNVHGKPITTARTNGRQLINVPHQQQAGLGRQGSQ